MCVFLYLTLAPPLNKAKTVLMDGKEAHVDLPKRVAKISAALLRAENNKPATLPSQKQAVETFQLVEAAKCAVETKLAVEATNDRDSESMDSVDGKHDFITIPNDRDSESMDYKYS